MTDNTVPCGLPPATGACKSHVAAPAPCPEEYCEQPITILPYCPPCELPPPPQICGLMEEGCDWTASCKQSIPHAIGCSPLVTGWGAYDGGVPWWAKDGFCVDDCDAKLRMAEDPTRPRYRPNDWESFMDLNTHTDFNVRMTVMRNGHPARMSVNEFTAMTHKVITLAKCHNLLVEPSDVPQPGLFGVGMVKTGNDANGKPIYGLSVMYNGAAIGTSMPLVSTRDAGGVITGLRLAHEIAAAQEALTP